MMCECFTSFKIHSDSTFYRLSRTNHYSPVETGPLLYCFTKLMTDDFSKIPQTREISGIITEPTKSLKIMFVCFFVCTDDQNFNLVQTSVEKLCFVRTNYYLVHINYYLERTQY